MAIPRYKSIPTSDSTLTRIQTNVLAFSESVSDKLIFDGVLLTDIVLSASALNIAHTLDREPLGYIIVKQNANASIWTSTSTLPSRFLVLTASGAVTVSLWVF